MSVGEGALRIELVTEQGTVREVAIRSTRPVDACGALVGKSIEDAVRAVPRLFSVCAEAQAAAASAACEAALGRSTPLLVRVERARRVALETIDNHALQLATVWPSLLGEAPVHEPLRALRQATLRVREAVGEDTEPHWRIAAAEVRRLIEGLCPPLPSRVEELEGWCAGETMGQRLMRWALGADHAALGRAAITLLPDLPAGWFAAELEAASSFARLPTRDGAPAETGAFARWASTSLVAGITAKSGRGLGARLAAKLVDLHAALERAEAGVRAGAPLGGGRGTAAVETARGTLAHVVRVDGGRIASWQVVAPTEWNFHPQGVLAQGLVGTPSEGVEARARWIAAALDPCVALDVRVREAGHA